MTEAQTRPADPTVDSDRAAVPRPAGGGAERTRTYSWPDPMALAARIAPLSGLDVFTRVASGELPPPPVADTLGFSRIEATDGSVTVYLEPREFHFNPIGSMHGGVISAVLDTAAGCSVHTTLPAGIAYTSLDLHTRFLRPVTLSSGTLRCVGRVVSRGRQTALAEAHLYDAADKLVAHATSTCLIFPIPQ
jgi:uncharacterized protein (TIGR00369 family)